jgi:nitrogen regulatory protein PII
MTATVKRKKIEVIVDAPLVRRIIEAADQVGIRAHTLLPAVSGSGMHGGWSDDQLSGAGSKVMFVTVTSHEKASALIDALAPLLDDYRLMLVASDVDVVRGGKF